MNEAVLNQKLELYQTDDFSQLPGLESLMAKPRWLTWKLEPNAKDEWVRKQPYGRRSQMDWSNPANCFTHAEALTRKHPDGGIGYLIGDGTAAIDIDHCLSLDAKGYYVVAEWAKPILELADKLGCYTEVTVSQTGMRVIGQTARSEKIDYTRKGFDGDKKAGFELYCNPRGRYITVSGMDCDGAATASIDPVIDELQRFYPGTKRAKWDSHGLTGPQINAACKMFAEPEKLGMEEACRRYKEYLDQNPEATTGSGRKANLKVVSDINWRKDPNAGPGTPDADTMALVTGPIKGKIDKSTLFHNQVLPTLMQANYSPAEMTALLKQYPDGIAQRYIAEGRLHHMVDMTVGKHKAEHEARLAAAAPRLARAGTPGVGSIWYRPVRHPPITPLLRLVSNQPPEFKKAVAGEQNGTVGYPGSQPGGAHSTETLSETSSPPRPEPIPLPATPLFSDDYLASVFISRHGHELRYTAASGQWHRFDGKRWCRDETLAVYDFAKISNREIANTTTKETAKKIASAKTRAAVVSLAQSDRRIAATLAQWDADPWLLNTPDGVVDLRTGKMREHRPEDYMTKMTAVAPDFLNPHPPLFMKYMSEITNNDNELIDFHKKTLGYALTGITREHKMFFWWGKGRNGKGVLMSTTAGIFADYHVVIPIEALLASMTDRHPTEIAKLAGARLASAPEVPKGRSWNETLIKTMTGGDRMTARFMRKDFFDFDMQAKLFVSGNFKPSLRSVDEAIKARMNLVPFPVFFPEEARDDTLIEKLKPEWPKILAWMIEGCLAWQRDGLKPPKAVTAATESYLADQNLIAQFLEECCEFASESTLTARLFTVWVEWTRRAGEQAGRRKEFVDAMENQLGKQTHTNQGAAFVGVKLKTEAWILNAAAGLKPGSPGAFSSPIMSGQRPPPKH
jgi:putative DNA primase/helicase